MNRLKQARVIKGFNQWYLARLTGSHQTTISLFENDFKVPSDDQKKKIAGILGFEVKQIWPSDQ